MSAEIALPLSVADLKLLRMAAFRLWRHEQQRMRRLTRAKSKRVSGQAMHMADVKDLLIRLHAAVDGASK